MECEEEFDLLVGILRKFKWDGGNFRDQPDNPYHRKWYAHPTIMVTAEQALIVKMFWEVSKVGDKSTELKFKYN